MIKKTVTALLLLSMQGMAQPPAQKMQVFIDKLMSRMTLGEKIGQLNLLTAGDGIPTGSAVNKDVQSKILSGQVGGLFGIMGVEKIREAQEMAVNGSRLKIPLLFGLDIIHGYRTTFPIPLALASSWDMGLIEKSARAAAKESSADGLHWTFSPMVDISRDPRWGRVAEGAGEDPYLGSRIARAMVNGYQGDDLSSPSSLMACVKHFALYGAAEGGRDYNTTDMSRLRMYETYFPPYKAAIDAGAGSVMSSFNEIDGIPASANKWLLTDVLRRQWGFRGMVVSDYTSINEMIDHGLGDLKTVSARALNAGLDMDMVGEGYLTTLRQSLKEGKITLKQIDDACRRVLEAKYKLGLFEAPFREANAAKASTIIRSPEMIQTARELAAHATVLLKNDGQLLPLKRSGTIALIGPLANNKVDMQGTWAVGGNRAYAVTLLEGLQQSAGAAKILYAKGANITDDTLLTKNVTVFGKGIDIRDPEQQLAEALQAAAQADVIVAALGESAEMTGEAASRVSISLPESQRRLLSALRKTGKPIVVVLMTGRPLAIVEESAQADALLLGWFGGDEAGNGLADVLFGNYNPSGKLPMTFPRHVGQIPIYYSHKKTGRPQPVGQPTQKFRSNYLDESNEPLYPFGYGLSYTTFTYSDIRLSKKQLKATETLTASVTITNSGNYDGEEVVQLYINDPVASVTQPVKKLVGFQKIALKKGASKEVTFRISKEELSFYNHELKKVVEPGTFNLFIGGSSTGGKQVQFDLN
jgi:beta-glucosidase